ncbi:MAG: hypothetical protein B0D92_07470 [Spirochaeta sp. LUC14_002_19_P3]|nr:MAG: hypothetical protein B0D92_07470 [Spirochaeta sp. LUC14_002_19_P3]
MLRILSNETTAEVKTSQGSQSVQGHFGSDTKQFKYELGSANLYTRWVNDRLSIELHSKDDDFIEEVSLTFVLKSPKSASEISVWSESYTDEFETGMQACLPGIETQKQKRRGYWAIWIAESSAAEGLFFGQLPPALHPLSFQYHPFRHTLKITWTVNSFVLAAGKIRLSEVEAVRGKRQPLADAWQKHWNMQINKNLAASSRIGWLAGTEVSTPHEIREYITSLKNIGIKPNWFAVSSSFAVTGDWLEPADQFRRKMSDAARSISESYCTPGLQLAPFLVSRNSKTAEQNPQWLVNTSKGTPVLVNGYPASKDKCHVLDITNPKVRQHIKAIFTLMQDKWGFKMFIVDRVSDVAIAGRRADDSVPQGGLLRDAAKLIREAVGEQSLLAGMQVPLLSAPGIWNIQINSESMASSLSDKCALNTAETMIFRSGWNTVAWLNAPAPLPMQIFQSQNNTAFSTLRNAVALTAGAVILTGDPRTLNNTTDLKAFLQIFRECQKGRVLIRSQFGQGVNQTLAVKNSCGRLALFNFFPKKNTVCLTDSLLKSTLGIRSILSTSEGTVFNSPEIHIGLPPWGHRFFKDFQSENSRS